MFIIMELLLIIYRYVRSWIAGYFICMVVNLYMLIEQGNIRILRAYITYRISCDLGGSTAHGCVNNGKV